MKCSECNHWRRLVESDQYLPEDEIGECDGMDGDSVEIRLITGNEGGYVESIETKHDFFCANHKHT